MIDDLQACLEAWDRVRSGPNAGEYEDLENAGVELTESVRELLSKPENVQALTLARLMREHETVTLSVYRGRFSEGRWQVTLLPGVTYAIAPNGEVSS